MSPEQQAQSEGVDAQRGAERVRQILGEEPHVTASRNDAQMQTEPPKPARKKRSDAGLPKPKPAAAEPGMLTEEQSNRLQTLLEDVVQAERNHWIAEQKRNRAEKALNAYLESLTKTGQQ